MLPMMHVHIKSLLPINDIPETANKSPKIQSKPVRGLYRPAIMVPIHQVTHSDWQTVGSDRILHKDLSQCKGSILKSVSCRQPIVIDSETSGSSGHSPYNGSYPGGYTPSSEDISSHVSNHNNSPVISLSDNHGSPPIASHREQRRGGQQQSSMYHHHHPHYHHHLHHQQQQQHLQQHKAHHQQPQYSDIHDQIQNVPAFTSLASSEANFTSSVHCHASLGAMTPDLSMSVNNYKYYSTGTTACPMSPAVSTIEREIHCYQPSLNQTEMTSLNFSPLRQ
ncbi:zinc finger protein 629-like [Argonauta hians]